jgi:neutral amino acid transport system permease protein
VALLALGALATFGGPAAAQSDAETSVGGTIFAAPDEPGGERRLIEGVELTVRLGNEEVGSDTTDEAGEWRVEVPGAGNYQVSIDTETLPEDVGLRDPERDVLDNVNVRAGQAKNVLFPLGEGGGGTTWGDRFDRLADLAANGIKVGAIIALASVGLSLIFGITGLVNFAHGELVTIGAVVTWWLNASGPRLPLLVAGIFGVLAGALAGFTLEKGLFHPLRKRRMGNVALMVVTIGLSQFLRHIILLFFDGRPRKYEQYALQRAVEIGPISIQPKDIIITVFALALLLLVGYLLRATTLGTAMRAVSDNRDLAESSGIDVQKVILVVWVAGAALAALGGILYGTSQTVSWDLGFILLLSMFAATVLGGLGSPYGAMVGGLVIGLVSELSTYWLETELKYATSLAVLILVLLFRPQGILGTKERIG